MRGCLLGDSYQTSKIQGIGSVFTVEGGQGSGFMIWFLCSLPPFHPLPPLHPLSSAVVQHIQKPFKCKAIYNTE